MKTQASARVSRWIGGALGKDDWSEDKHPRAEDGKFTDGGGGTSTTTHGKADVFVAGLRNFKGKFADVERAYSDNKTVKQLFNDATGSVGESLSKGVGGTVGTATVETKSRSLGAWYETDSSGKKIAVSEPSVHMIVEGDEDEIIREAAMVGKEFDQQAVAVAVHDAAGEGRVFSLQLGATTDRGRMEAVLQHVLDAGLGGATAHLDPPPSFHLLALTAVEAKMVRDAVDGLPEDFGAVLVETPARVRFVGSDEYASVIGTKYAAKAGKVKADVFIGGVRR